MSTLAGRCCRLSKPLFIFVLSGIVAFVLIYDANFVLEVENGASSMISALPSCREVGTSTLIRHPFPDYPRNLTDFLTGDGLDPMRRNSSTAAVCEFYKKAHTEHFPHAMEQLYSCWSWWRANPTKHAVLVRPKNHRGFPEQHTTITNRSGYDSDDFFLGFVRALKDVFDVSIEMTHSGPSVKKRLIWAEDHTFTLNSFALLEPSHAEELAQKLTAYYSIPRQACGGSQHNGPTSPRIAILNRKKDSLRSLLNVDGIKYRLRMTLGLNADVDMVHFESKSFLDQIKFYSSHDIIISPHGAQLTGMAFLPRCGAILELFPKGYYKPHYFGSLANAAGLAHYGIYVSPGDWRKENAPEGKVHVLSRMYARRADMCPAIDTIAASVSEIIHDWRSCCFIL